MKRVDILNENIFDLYFTKGLNRRQTAERLGCSQDLIAYRLKQMNLKPKTMSDCVESGKKVSVPLSNILIEILNGEMLGDGGLIIYKNQASFRESFGFDKKEWAEYLFNLFVNNNICIVGNTIYKRNPSGKSPNFSWSFETCNIIELGNLHKTWYTKNNDYNLKLGQGFKNRKYLKIIPTNLNLTPKSLLHWYVGDGTVYSSGGCMIHTEGFNWKEVEFLRYKLKQEFNIFTSHNKKNTIYLPTIERAKLLEIVGKCPVKCYNYKWDFLKTKAKNMPFNSHIDMKLVEQFIKN